MIVQGCQGYRSELTIESTVNKGKVCRAYGVARARLISLATLPCKSIAVAIKGSFTTSHMGWMVRGHRVLRNIRTINEQGKVGSL